MTPLKFGAKALIFLILFVSVPIWGLANEPTSYQSTLEKFYNECSSLIYEKYIQQGYEAVFWGGIENDTEYDLAVLYNDSIINLIKKLDKRKENRTFDIAEKTEAQISKLKESFRKINKGEILSEPILNIEKIAIAEIIVNKVSIREKDFSLKLSLQITTLDNVDQPFKLTQSYRGHDKAIDNYIIKKQFSPFATLSFIGFTLFIFIALFFVPTLKRYGIIKEENISFYYMGILIYIIAILVFIGLTYLKHNLISSSAFFKGAEVYFFVDTNAGLYFEPQAVDELNFTEISNLLGKKIFEKISSNLYMSRSLSEKLSDSIFIFINRIFDAFRLKNLRIREFLELKKSDYFYKFYTFTFDEYKGLDKLKPLSEGRFGEIEANFDQNLAQVYHIHSQNRGQSSLIKPLMQLIKLLDEKKYAEDATRRMKRFIIILTDADEGYEENIRELLGHISYFYKKKDQYLRVFSILFPNLPKSEDKIYYSETGKLILLSKISEMIVNLNANKSFDVEKFRRENKLYYQELNLPVDERMEHQYNKKLDELKIFVKANRIPSIEEIANRHILMDYIRDKERQYIRMLKEARGYAHATDDVDYQDFFIYTYASNLYCMEHIGKSMSSKCEHKHTDCNCDGLEFAQKALWAQNEDIKIDYNTTRTKYFSLKKNKSVVDDLDLIKDVFVDQFIFISFDKERLASSLNKWLPYLTILLGLSFAWLLYRYRYQVNYKFGWHDIITHTFIIGVIFIIQLSLYLYIQLTKNNWIIYGNFLQAMIVSLGFAVCVYIVPQAINLVLLKKVSGEKDVLFSFEQPRWLTSIDRYLFDFVLLPIMTHSIFLMTGFPVLKQIPHEANGLFKYVASFLFLDYNNIIDAFLIVWGAVGILYIIRSLIFSNTLKKHYKFS